MDACFNYVLMAGFDPVHESAVAVNRDDDEEEEFKHSSDGPTEQSGYEDPVEIPRAEVVQLTDEINSTDASVLMKKLFSSPVSPVSGTVSPSSAEVETGSSEAVTFQRESNISSDAEPLEETQDESDQEGLEESPAVLLSTVQNFTDDSSGEGEREEADESSWETPQRKSKLSLTNSADHASEGIIDEAGTNAPPQSLVPHLTFTPSWEPEPSTRTPEESLSDREHSAELPVHEDSDEISTEQGFTTAASKARGKVLYN